MRLTDQAKELFFTEQGFVKLDHFLDKDQVQSLQDLYKKTKLGNVNGLMYTNIQDLSYDECLEIEDAINKVCLSAVGKYLSGYRIVGSTFLIKGKGVNSDSFVHQDWSIVDESKYRSALLWIPLTDTNEQNGCLQILPGSHKWFHTVRSSTVPTLSVKFGKKIDPYLLTLPLKTGEAALFQMKLFHGSRANLSAFDRPAITLTVIDEKAKFLHYIKDPGNYIRVVECSKDFLYRRSFNLNTNDTDVNVKELERINDPQRVVINEGTFFNKLYREKLKGNTVKRIWKRVRNLFTS